MHSCSEDTAKFHFHDWSVTIIIYCLHNVRECWVEFAVVIELPLEKLPDTMDITLKVPMRGFSNATVLAPHPAIPS